MSRYTEAQLAASIENTNLSATASADDIDQLCEDAMRRGFAAVCVNPRWIDRCVDHLAQTNVNIVTVAGFPLGADTTEVKVYQVQQAIRAGADEVDMVIDLAALTAGDTRYLKAQLQAVMRVCQSMRPVVTLKVILETAALTFDQKLVACALASQAGVDFVKTSTGLHPAGGATVDDVRLLKAEAHGCRVKAAGGIRTATQAMDLLEAGAERIGTSAGIQILESGL